MSDHPENGGTNGRNGLPIVQVVFQVSFLAACWVIAVCVVLLTFWVLSR